MLKVGEYLVVQFADNRLVNLKREPVIGKDHQYLVDGMNLLILSFDFDCLNN